MSDKTHMHGDGESDSGVVPAKQPNKSGQPPAEAVEGRPLTKENMDQPNQYRTQKRGSWSSKLAHVREVAKKDKTHIPLCAWTPNIQGKNRVRE